ncbi:MAG: tetratricopeptide repeat protein [Bacteroidales bacterium]|nr:tetratricopeptide repeat protein [Bacteroidales bacterium]
MKRMIFILLLFPFFSSASNQSKIDSLEQRLSIVSGEEKFFTLYKLAQYYSMQDMEKSLNFSHLAFQQAKKMDDINLYQKGLNAMAISNFYLGNNYEALIYFKELYGILSLKIKNDPKNERLHEEFAIILSNMGNIYSHIGNVTRALGFFLISLEYTEQLFIKHPNDQEIIITYIYILNNIGLLYLELEDYKKALGFIDKAFNISREAEMKDQIALCLNNIGLINIKNQNFKEAKQNYLEALEINEKIGDSLTMSGNMNNLGLIYEKQKKCLEALDYYKSSLLISKRINYKYGIANTYGNIGKIYTEINRLDSAVFYLQKAANLAQSVNEKNLIKKTYNYLYLLYQKKNNVSEALKYYNLFTEVKDSLFNEEKSRQIIEMETKYETHKKEKENEILRKDAEISKRVRQMLIIGITAFFILSALLFFLFRLKNKSLKQRTHIFEQENQLNDLTLKKKEIEKKQVQDQLFAEKQINRLQKDKIEQKNRELSTTALHIINKNTTLTNILKEIEEAKKEKDTGIDKCFNKLRSVINSNLALDDDWMQFKLHFNEVHPRFFSVLKYKFPDLTPGEQKLCAYLRINLNSKEIARMLNITLLTIKKNRNRLRKKLNLDKEANLIDFINSL